MRRIFSLEWRDLYGSTEAFKKRYWSLLLFSRVAKPLLNVPTSLQVNTLETFKTLKAGSGASSLISTSRANGLTRIGE
jgi:hypothetical protein